MSSGMRRPFFVWRRHGISQTQATLRKLHQIAGRVQPVYAFREWLGRSFDMCVSSTVEAISQYAEVIVIGLLVNPASAAGYFIAARLANVFSMVATGLDTYTITHASRLHFSGDKARLQAILRTVMTVAFALIAPTYLLLMAFGSQALSIFGRDYLSQYDTLAILATAGIVITLSGPASGILMMTGSERLCSRIALSATVLRLSITVVLATRFGAQGAAVSWALINAPVAIFYVVLCKRICGVDASIFSLVGRKPSVARRPVDEN